jgi:hypothetical protein
MGSPRFGESIVEEATARPAYPVEIPVKHAASPFILIEPQAQEVMHEP